MKFRLISGISLYLAFLSQFALSPLLRADENRLTWDVNQQPTGRSSSASWVKFSGTGAVDANGVRHSASDYGRKRPPWLLDTTNAVAPYRQYGISGRFLGRLQGRGLFRLQLDLKTGYVTNVTVFRSTEIAELDTSAVDALRRWRWKPGKWKEIEMAVAFTRP
jgi:TonB family protein